MDLIDKESLRLEYDKTQEMAIHYDTMNWTIGSILLAGIFGMAGLIGDKIQAYPQVAVLSFIILLVWRVFYKRHKEIQRVKFTRLQEIEKELHLRQHLLVNEQDKLGKMTGIKGDHMATILTIMVPLFFIITYLAWKFLGFKF